jgi:hypothetical protein
MCPWQVAECGCCLTCQEQVSWVTFLWKELIFKMLAPYHCNQISESTQVLAIEQSLGQVMKLVACRAVGLKQAWPRLGTKKVILIRSRFIEAVVHSPRHA